MIDIFGDRGALHDLVKNYEYREEQLLMARFIMERLYAHQNGIIEAGTGTGKTLAYLVPALMYALEEGKKITVSTETKALQKQLIDKDIPLVQELFTRHTGKSFSCSLCLGSANYPCRKRFERIVQQGLFRDSQKGHIEDIAARFKAKKIFTRLDLNIPSRLWDDLCREADSCPSFRCPFAHQCVYLRARKEWNESTLLVMNHYLFFSNIASGKTYLPRSDILIFDEAHSVEDIASAQLGCFAGYDQINEIMSRFHRPRKKNVLLRHITKKVTRTELQALADDITAGASAFFESLRNSFAPKKLTRRAREPLSRGVPLVKLIKEFMVLLAESEDEYDQDEYLKMEFDIARGKLFLYLENLTLMTYQNREEYVYWLERDNSDMPGDIRLRAQPVDIAGIMNSEVLNCHESSIFTSATCAINGDFSYIAARLGIDRCETMELRSTFDYAKQMLVYIARDLPLPDTPDFTMTSTQTASELIRAVQGNCLMLFTSYKMLTETRLMLESMITMSVYSQDRMPASEAMARYLDDHNSILMGTHSFWQGIDLPGDLLRGVLVMKLPFAVPDSPPVEARVERLREAGKNPFIAYQVPEAVIRFKQGIGRLIRSRQDRGIVAVMDSRLLKKPYGKTFIRALPQGCKITYSMEEFRAGLGK